MQLFGRRPNSRKERVKYKGTELTHSIWYIEKIQKLIWMN